jgi:nitrogen-specific signal transduction histidine kinase/ActR/RegA family two-component response regulator
MGEGYANFVFFRDVTERKQLQADAQRAHRMDSLGRLAGGIAHDFNNLISSIQSALALARTSAGDPEALTQALSQAESATSRAADLTRQLLTFSRGGETVASSVDPNDVVHETLGLLGLAADRFSLDLDLDPAVGKVWIDPSRLHQVVMNLLLNARDALKNGGEIRVRTLRVRFEGELSESHARAGDWISIEVSDSGDGMSAETQSRIFEPFFTTKPSGQGTGLGLSTVYGVVRQAGGWVEVQSELGRGTRFSVFLPALGVTTVPPESMARRQHGKDQQRVLVCDDEVRLAMLTAGLLEQRGFEVDTVSSGLEALEALMQPGASYHALLLDVNLSGMSAAELLAAIVERGLSVPVVLSSGYSEEDLPLELRQQALVVGYLAKPYPLEQLYDVIDRAALTARG